MQIRPILLLLAAPLAAGPAVAQAVSLADRVIAAATLPALARDLRVSGVPDKDVSDVLGVLSNRKVRPEDARVILKEEADAARQHGPVDNFGAFVQSKLDQGLRGRELAAAIRAEHAARGIKGAAGRRDERVPAAGRKDDDKRGEAKEDEHKDHEDAKPDAKGKGRDENPGTAANPGKSGAAKQRGQR